MDYDAKLPFYYRNNYEFFSRYLPHVKHKKDNGLLEKSKIRWFSYDELKKEKKNFRSFYQNIVDLILKRQDEITNKIHNKENNKENNKKKTLRKQKSNKSKTRKNKKL